MENGSDLLGDTSSTQSAIIIPQPDNPNIYFIITVDVIHNHTDDQTHEIVIDSTNGLRFSVVDISQNEGNGLIIQKNVMLLDSSLEKITAVKHQNNKDYWIIAHEWGSDDFYTWCITETGISLSPVISSTGYTYEFDIGDAVGYMKINPFGNTLAVALLISSKFEILSLIMKPGRFLFFSKYLFDTQVYSCEFSPDRSKLYLTTQLKVFQVDLNAGTPENIINSLTEIYQLDDPVGALQLAVDGRMYIASDSAEFLSVINYPNELPINCGFEYNALYLDGRESNYGLPNFIASYYSSSDF